MSKKTAPQILRKEKKVHIERESRLNEILESIHELVDEYGGDAWFEMSIVETGYYGRDIEFLVSYEIEETPAEFAARVQKEKDIKKAARKMYKDREAEERKLYLQLKEKYEGT